MRPDVASMQTATSCKAVERYQQHNQSQCAITSMPGWHLEPCCMRQAAAHRRFPPQHRFQPAAGAAPFEDPGPFTVAAPEADSDVDLPIVGLTLPDTDMLPVGPVDHDRFPSPPPLFMIGSLPASPGVPPPAAKPQMLDSDLPLAPPDMLPSASPGPANRLEGVVSHVLRASRMQQVTCCSVLRWAV